MQINKKYTIIASVIAAVLITTAVYSQHMQTGTSSTMGTTIGISTGMHMMHDHTIILHITSGEARDPYQVQSH